MRFDRLRASIAAPVASASPRPSRELALPRIALDTPTRKCAATGTLRPALDTFYNSLSDEQKAVFDAIGPDRNGVTTALAADKDESPRPHHRRHPQGYSVGGMIFRMMGL